MGCMHCMKQNNYVYTDTILHTYILKGVTKNVYVHASYEYEIILFIYLQKEGFFSFLFSSFLASQYVCT